MWRRADRQYITPLLEGVDGNGSVLITAAQERYRRHTLVVEPMDGHNASPLVVVPINSANWSQVALDERPELQAVINAGFEKLGDPGSAKNQRLRKLIESLLVHDIARVSTVQRDAISVLFRRMEHLDTIKLDDNTIRMVVLHHHLLPIGATEEVKTFESMINLGALRQFLANERVNIAVHGHKHTEAIYADRVELPRKDKPHHEILVVSGGSYKSEPDENISPCRVMEIAGLPFDPEVIIHPVNVPLHGGIPNRHWVRDGNVRRVRACREAARGPIVVSDSSIDRLYEKARKIAARPNMHDGGRTIITHLEIPENISISESKLPFPKTYESEIDQTPNWVNEVVRWWQLPASNSQDRVPYIHGVRLYRYNGFLDQMQRITNLLDSHSGRISGASGSSMADAIAVLLDPLQDFEDVEIRAKRGYLAFCLLQFVHRNGYLDVIAYYRAQEFNYWWPVNVAELVYLLRKVISELKNTLKLGSVITITPIAQVSDAQRTPTRVALPLIDQLLDYEPHMLANMMDVLSRAPVEWGEHDKAVVEKWKACLKDLRVGNQEYNSQSNPVAIKAVEIILNCIKTSPKRYSSRMQELQDIIERLLEVNRSFENSDQRKQDFAIWQPHVHRQLSKLEELLKP